MVTWHFWQSLNQQVHTGQVLEQAYCRSQTAKFLLRTQGYSSSYRQQLPNLKDFHTHQVLELHAPKKCLVDLELWTVKFLKLRNDFIVCCFWLSISQAQELFHLVFQKIWLKPTQITVTTGMVFRLFYETVLLNKYAPGPGVDLESSPSISSNPSFIALFLSERILFCDSTS